MAIVYPYVVNCRCGATITANLADGVNVHRTPEIRAEILAGSFHRIGCPRCKETFTAEKSFLYTDLDRGTFIQVKPRQDRHLWRAASAALTRAAEVVPEAMLPAEGRKLRVVFGIAELREKLVAEDLKFDDRVVELLKVFALNDHPFLMQRPRLRMVLNGASETELEFIASYDFEHDNFRVALPLAAARDLANRPDVLKSWMEEAKLNRPLFAMGDDHWVNIWRWSPQPGALEQLKDYADKLRRGEPVDTGSADFRSMLDRLPRGSHLPGWAKQDLQVLFDEAKRIGNEALKDALFELRFAKTLADDWSTNTSTTDIDTLWQLLRALPPSDVEGNASIDEINLAIDEGGGWYEPDTKDVYIGSRLLTDRENFEDVVRHEIGHGVHESRADKVNDWLNRTFGWQMFSSDRPGLDRWVGLMGGWGAVPEARRGEVLSYLKTALGPGGKWGPTASPNVPAGHPWWNADFGPRLAFERTGSNWYQNHGSWFRAGGRAFFLNYWYRTLCVVNEDTLALVTRMPSSYAAMSTYEFFAELYALYYDLDDPKRSALPPAVLAWFEATVGQPLARPAPPGEDAKEEWETVDRPDR